MVIELTGALASFSYLVLKYLARVDSDKHTSLQHESRNSSQDLFFSCSSNGEGQIRTLVLGFSRSVFYHSATSTCLGQRLFENGFK